MPPPSKMEAFFSSCPALAMSIVSKLILPPVKAHNMASVMVHVMASVMVHVMASVMVPVMAPSLRELSRSD